MAVRQLLVDWPACRANGVCSDLLPEFLPRDEWGYPRVPDRPVPARFTEQAEQAVTQCPTSALRLVEVPDPPGTRRERRRLVG